MAMNSAMDTTELLGGFEQVRRLQIKNTKEDSMALRSGHYFNIQMTLVLHVCELGVITVCFYSFHFLYFQADLNRQWEVVVNSAQILVLTVVKDLLMKVPSCVDGQKGSETACSDAGVLYNHWETFLKERAQGSSAEFSLLTLIICNLKRHM